MADVRKLNGLDGAPGHLRLTPDMVSLRLLVLAFVKGYIGRWGASPSYGEIAEATGTNRTRVKKAVRSLQDDGLLLRVDRPGSGGARALALPTQRDAAVQLLAELGMTVVPALQPDLPPDAITDRALHPVQRLDYHPATGTRLERAGPDDRRLPGHGEDEGAQGGPEA